VQFVELMADLYGVPLEGDKTNGAVVAPASRKGSASASAVEATVPSATESKAAAFLSTLPADDFAGDDLDLFSASRTRASSTLDLRFPQLAAFDLHMREIE